MSIAAILLTAITGVILIYPEQSRQLLLEPFLNQSGHDQVVQVLDDLSGHENTGWLAVLNRTNSLYPEARFRWASPSSKSYPYRVVGVQQQHGWNPTGQTAVYIEASSGTMAGNTDALSQSAIERLFNFTYPLHIGGLGLWYRLLLSLFGLAMFLLSAFGLTSYLKQ